MAEITLNNLLNTDKASHGSRDPAVRMESLFMQTLQIESLVDSLFRFRTAAAKKTALNIINELSQDYELISQRQEALRYLINSLDYVKLQGIFDNLFRQYSNLEDMLHPNPGMHFGRTAEMHIKRTELNAMYGLLDNILSNLGQFGNLAVGSRFAEIGITLQGVFGSESYKELASKFPLPGGYEFKEIPIKSSVSHDDEEDYGEDEDYISEYSHLFHSIEWYHQSLSSLIVTLDYFMSYAKGFRRLSELGANIVFPEIVNNKGVRLCDIKQAVNKSIFEAIPHL